MSVLREKKIIIGGIKMVGYSITCPYCQQENIVSQITGRHWVLCGHCNTRYVLNDGHAYTTEQFANIEQGQKIAEELFKKPLTCLAKQEGGSHYKDMGIQPAEYITKNGISFLAGNAIKYLSRHHLKGKAEDIKKAIHYCEMILEMEYGIKIERSITSRIADEYDKLYMQLDSKDTEIKGLLTQINSLNNKLRDEEKEINKLKHEAAVREHFLHLP